MELPVRYEDRRVAIIRAEAGATSLTYTEAWRSGPDRFPVSLTMPLQVEAVGSELILPWLMNLLPEGEGLAGANIPTIHVEAVVSRQSLPPAGVIKRCRPPPSASLYGFWPASRSSGQRQLVAWGTPQGQNAPTVEGIALALIDLTPSFPPAEIRAGRFCCA
nr:HipA N-terminal domain-containing protein [Novosphingobium aerophilum]